MTGEDATRHGLCAYTAVSLVLIMALLTSLIAFPFQMIKVVEAIEGFSLSYWYAVI
jgi:hypothetical protein